MNILSELGIVYALLGAAVAVLFHIYIINLRFLLLQPEHPARVKIHQQCLRFHIEPDFFPVFVSQPSHILILQTENFRKRKRFQGDPV